MERTVKQEFSTFLTTAGHNIMGEVMRGERKLVFATCQIGDGLWSVVKNQDDYTIDVPQQLKSPVPDGLFDIDSLKENSRGVTEVVVNIPVDFGPATINEAAWILDDGTIYAVTRYPSLPVLPAGNGGGSEISIRAILRVGDAEQVTLIIDSGITASRQFVEHEVVKIRTEVTQKTNELALQLDNLPVSFLVTDPILTGDLEQSIGNNISLSVSGGVSAWHNTSLNSTIERYEFLLPDGTTVNGSHLIWPIPNDPELIGTESQFKVRAIDTAENYSQWIVRTVAIVSNLKPVITNFTHNVPSIAIKNQVVSVAFAGATDPDGDDSQITYRITNSENVVASKNDDIVAGVSLDLTFADITLNTSASLTLVAIDQAGVQSAPKVISVDLRKLAIINKPIGLTPTTAAIDIDKQPHLSSTPFETNPLSSDTHLSTQLQVSKNADFAVNNIVIDMTIGAVTSAQVDQSLLSGQLYFWRIKYEGSELGWSDWSDTMEFTTTVIATGSVLSDGGIIGPQVNGYFLVVAPASARESLKHGLFGTDTTLQNITNASTPDPDSGFDNTNTLINNYGSVNDGSGSIGPAAANFCRALGDDYYLPNKEEAAAIAAMGSTIDDADTSNGNTFSVMAAGYMWTSTEYNNIISWMVRTSDGYLNNYSRNKAIFVVPIRRIPV